VSVNIFEIAVVIIAKSLGCADKVIITVSQSYP